MINFRCKLLSPILTLFLTFTACATPIVWGNDSSVDVLSALGLLKGQDSGFALELCPTRAEAVTMAVRLGGQELEAMLSSTSSGFEDVPPGHWAFPYVKQAAGKGYVNGVTDALFAPDETVTAAAFTKMLLGALGYPVTTLETAAETASQIGLSLPASSEPFNRGIMAEICYGALSVKMADGVLVRDMLVTKNIVSAADMERYFPAEAATHSSEIVSITSFDGYTFDGKLDIPSDKSVSKLVVFANGSGPTTYDNHRENGELKFNYFDLFAEEFAKRDIAFFRFNSRGVTPGDEPPYFADIDEEAYQTYLPSNEVQDLEAVIATLKQDGRLKDAKVYLLGWSAGTITAPLVALRGNVPVDALLLAGYSNEKMDETLEWQNSGGSSMVFYRAYFDYDENGEISKEEFEEDRYEIKDLLATTFEGIDKNTDGKLTKDDFAIMLKDTKAAIFKAIEDRDDEWLKENYGVRLTSGWFLDYRNNIDANRDTLPKIDIPIHIFHGTEDANLDVQGVYDIEQAFKNLGKTNLTVHVFKGHDHDLNYMHYFASRKLSEGMQSIFDTSAELN